jgi:hypothetical protein
MRAKQERRASSSRPRTYLYQYLWDDPSLKSILRATRLIFQAIAKDLLEFLV